MRKTLVLFLGLILLSVAGLACGGSDAAPTKYPTATSPAPTATAAAEATATTQKVKPTAAVTSESGSIELQISSASSDELQFDTETLTASTGQQVVLTLANNAVTQQHNWVLVIDGTKDAVAAAGLTAGQDNNWVSPDDTNVIASTELLAAGESGQVTFTAPASGTYEFICTFPGHNLTMAGTFTVTP